MKWKLIRPWDEESDNDCDDEKRTVDSGSLVGFTPAAAGVRKSALYFNRIFWGGDPDGAGIQNKCETRIDVWVVRRAVEP